MELQRLVAPHAHAPEPKNATWECEFAGALVKMLDLQGRIGDGMVLILKGIRLF